MKSRRAIFCLALAMPALSSCSDQLVRIKPYERGVLAKPVMAENLDPLQKAMTEHAYFSREASFGGGGVFLCSIGLCHFIFNTLAWI
jgi:hypothetical protein